METALGVQREFTAEVCRRGQTRSAARPAREEVSSRGRAQRPPTPGARGEALQRLLQLRSAPAGPQDKLVAPERCGASSQGFCSGFSGFFFGAAADESARPLCLRWFPARCRSPLLSLWSRSPCSEGLSTQKEISVICRESAPQMAWQEFLKRDILDYLGQR